MYTSLVLLFMFAFIFVGISAFSLGGSFNSVVNSLVINQKFMYDLLKLFY